MRIDDEQSEDAQDISGLRLRLKSLSQGVVGYVIDLNSFYSKTECASIGGAR